MTLVTANTSDDRLEDLHTTDDQPNSERSPEDEESDDINDGGDTSRVVDSATSYARECLRTENYTEATIALRSVLEISNPSTASYKMVVLNIVQLLKAAQQLETSIDCMLTIYQAMPSPFSRIDGICIIACLYEQLGSIEGARFWWKKLRPSSSSNGLGVFAKPGLQLWEAMADRLFEMDLYLFAAEFYGQALAADVEHQFVPSNRFRYRYLSSLLAFVGSEGPTLHMSLCRSVAWSLAQWFRRRNGNASHMSACYGDPHFYPMRTVYLTSFPAMHRIVFEWVDGPAGRIARWWRRHWVKLHPPPSSISPDPASISSAKPKLNKKPSHNQASFSRQPRSQTRTGDHGKLAASPSKSPSPMRKPHSNEQIRQKPGRLPDQRRKTKKNSGVEQRPGLSNNSLVVDSQQFLGGLNDATLETGGNSRSTTKVSNRLSPAKRRINLVKRIRGTDPKVERPSSAGVEKASSDEEQTMARSSSTSLLDIYPLQLSNTEDFVTSCGRGPGFADLDLNEVGEFARFAHYRARVLSGKHAPVSKLDTTKVKPQWLQDLERAVTLIVTHQQRILASGKAVVKNDSVALLSEVHTRLVLQITTLCRQYTRDFGETSFTRRLRGLTRKLVEWKFTRISEVIASLDDAQSIAMQEEKQRNLEFYHVHRV